jgi:hypothetical protein
MRASSSYQKTIEQIFTFKRAAYHHTTASDVKGRVVTV